MKKPLVALFVSLLMVGCGGQEIVDNKPATVEAQSNATETSEEPQKAAPTKDTAREVSWDDTERRDGVAYVKGAAKPFTGTVIEYYEDGSVHWKTPYVNGKAHGTAIFYREDGSKRSEYVWVNGEKRGTAILYRKDGSKERETPFVEGKWHGTRISYYSDGSKWEETVWENDNRISIKEWDQVGNLK